MLSIIYAECHNKPIMLSVTNNPVMMGIVFWAYLKCIKKVYYQQLTLIPYKMARV
jgi:hypothetical protein